MFSSAIPHIIAHSYIVPYISDVIQCLSRWWHYMKTWYLRTISSWRAVNYNISILSDGDVHLHVYLAKDIVWSCDITEANIQQILTSNASTLSTGWAYDAQKFIVKNWWLILPLTLHDIPAWDFTARKIYAYCASDTQKAHG